MGRFLLEQFELRLPGLREWTDGVAQSFAAQAEAELRRMEQQARELEVGTPEDWQRLRRAVAEVLLPRWGALARAQIDRVRRDYGLWRGGDLVARAVFALAGFALGVFIVEVPYIPITVKWFPTATALAAPFLPDAWIWFCGLRHRRAVQALADDLAIAAQQMELYRPLSELGAGLDLTERDPAAAARARDRS